MRDTIVRALESVIAVIVGILVASRFGEGDKAKLTAVLVGGAVAIVLEYCVKNAPKHSRSIRRLLDSRAVFEGVWLQNVKHVTNARGLEASAFAVVVITHSGEEYSLEGFAYDAVGVESSRWRSVEQLHFSPNGRSMSYQWKGTVIPSNEATDPGDLNRGGFASVQLSSDDSGTGKAEHLSMRQDLIFNMERVTPNMTKRWRAGSRPDVLRSGEDRDHFALDYAKRLTARAA